MGWISYHASCYKGGTVDRKAECDAYFVEGLNEGHFEVLKSVMVGSTYYAAVRNLKRCVGEKEGKRIYESLENGSVWAAVFLTSVNMRDYFNFTYKDMDETVGPCQCDCPESILKLLNPTDSDFAFDWRKKCRIQNENKNKMSKLPIGTKIKFKAQYDMTDEIKSGDEIVLVRCVEHRRGKTRKFWYDGCFRWRKNLIPDNYEL